MATRHMSALEVAKLDIMQKQGKSAHEILCKLKEERARNHEKGPSLSAVYRYMGGETYQRGSEERRGHQCQLPRSMVKVATQQRLKLAREADSEWQVTWEDVWKATKKELRRRGLLKKSVRMPGVDWFSRIVRDQSDVKARPGKRKITHEKDYKVKRYKQSKTWRKYSASWWKAGKNKIHAYIDSKTFVIARTPEQKKLLRTQRVTRHLRSASEGNLAFFVLPKRSHSFVGIPSVTITAAVVADRVLMWHETAGRWNGDAAAKMYVDLGQKLRSHYGSLPFFRVVEDGDTKGFQSGKGIMTKKDLKIRSWKLPPHTPSWMPLDYSLWQEIHSRTLSKRVSSEETPEEYKKRLNLTAKRLSKQLVKSVLAKMKDNIEAVHKAKGGHTKLD